MVVLPDRYDWYNGTQKPKNQVLARRRYIYPTKAALIFIEGGLLTHRAPQARAWSAHQSIRTVPILDDFQGGVVVDGLPHKYQVQCRTDIRQLLFRLCRSLPHIWLELAHGVHSPRSENHVHLYTVLLVVLYSRYLVFVFYKKGGKLLHLNTKGSFVMNHLVLCKQLYVILILLPDLVLTTCIDISCLVHVGSRKPVLGPISWLYGSTSALVCVVHLDWMYYYIAVLYIMATLTV